jgi:hypothetical protein
MSTPTDSGAQGAPRGPGSVQLVIAVAVTVLIATLSLTVHQQPPPAIAEFAPQAVKQIKQAPPEQSSDFGTGEGQGKCREGAACAVGKGPKGGAGGSPSPGGAPSPPPVSPAASPSAPAKVVPRQKRCVGDRQTEDPQSPPCVSFWDDSHGNGGATSFGVTADTITIGIPNKDDTDSQYAAYANFFNDRYEFYGRKIRFVDSAVDSSTPAGEQAAADAMKQMGVFISNQEHGLTTYYSALNRYGIMGVYRTPDYSDAQLNQRSPYLWGYYMSATQIMSHLSDYVCTRLVGGNAEFAGTSDATDLTTKKRVFGIVLEQQGVNNQLRVAPMKAALEACGASVPFTIEVPYNGQTAADGTNQIVEMKAKGVTSVICLCEEGNRATYYWAPATAQTFFPEWIVTNYPQLIELGLHLYNVAAQSAHMFGVAFQPMERLEADHPSIWALQEGSGGAANLHEPLAIQTHDITYRALLLIASGIQMAGPKLTPQTFAAGLQRVRFPNPEHPIQAGTVGFADGDHSMTNDGAEFWWSNADQSPYSGESQGAMCWVRGGRHFTDGQWDKSSPLFTGTCDTGNKQVS